MEHVSNWERESEWKRRRPYHHSDQSRPSVLDGQNLVYSLGCTDSEVQKARGVNDVFNSVPHSFSWLRWGISISFLLECIELWNIDRRTAKAYHCHCQWESWPCPWKVVEARELGSNHRWRQSPLNSLMIVNSRARAFHSRDARDPWWVVLLEYNKEAELSLLGVLGVPVTTTRKDMRWCNSSPPVVHYYVLLLLFPMDAQDPIVCEVTTRSLFWSMDRDSSFYQPKTPIPMTFVPQSLSHINSGIRHLKFKVSLLATQKLSHNLNR